MEIKIRDAIEQVGRIPIAGITIITIVTLEYNINIILKGFAIIWVFIWMLLPIYKNYLFTKEVNQTGGKINDITKIRI